MCHECCTTWWTYCGRPPLWSRWNIAQSICCLETQVPHLRWFHVSICRVRRYADGPVTLRLLSHDQSWAGENTWKQTIVILTYLQDEEDIDIDADEQLSNKHRKKKNKVKTSQVQTWKPLSQVSVCAMLSIPTVWFSFAAFIIATACNGFLSINLEPQVGKY